MMNTYIARIYHQKRYEQEEKTQHDLIIPANNWKWLN
jgi:hypothetical protein